MKTKTIHDLAALVKKYAENESGWATVEITPMNGYEIAEKPVARFCFWYYTPISLDKYISDAVAVELKEGWEDKLYNEAVSLIKS